MRFLEIGLLLDGLFDYFGQLQAVDFIRESSSCKGGGEKWQMVTQQSEFKKSSTLPHNDIIATSIKFHASAGKPIISSVF